MIELARTVDNPIALRAVFGRLRFPGAWIGIGVVAIISAFVVGASFMVAMQKRNDLDTLRETMTVSLGLIFGLQCLLLYFGGTAAIATAVAADRERAVFDMMRMVPRPAWQIMGGYIFGMPVREHLWVLVMMPFAWLAALFSAVPLGLVAVMYGVFYAAGVLYHVIGALAGVVVRQPRAAASSSVGVIMLYYLFGSWFFPHLSIWPTAVWAFSNGEEMAFTEFFTLKVPVPLYDFLVMLVLATFLWIAAVRKFRREDRPVFSKTQALAFGSSLQLILLGSFFALLHSISTASSTVLRHNADGALFAYVLMSYPLALALVVLGTPGASLYSRSARRAIKMGRRSLNFLRDAGLNGAYALLIALVFSVTAPFLPGDPMKQILIPLIFSTSLLVFATLLQWSRLRFNRSWVAVFAGAMFLIWGLPIGLAIVCGIADLDPGVIATVGGFFPGIGLGYAIEGRGEAGLVVVSFINAVVAVAGFAMSLKASEKYWAPVEAVASSQ